MANDVYYVIIIVVVIIAITECHTLSTGSTSICCHRVESDFIPLWSGNDDEQRNV